jgi:mannosyltransferase OCH1-like enzyme
MWNFKPNENKEFDKNVINNNIKFIKNFDIIKPNLIKNLLETNDTFPELLELYDLIPKWIIKTDLGRLLIIFFKGGMYSDVDCFIEKQFNNNDDNDKFNVFLFTEHICNSVTELGSRECKNPENVLRVANFFFGCKTIKHPFFKEVIDECINRLNQLFIIEKKTNITNHDILWVCGPDVITSIYHKSKQNYNDILLHDKTFLNHKCYQSWR